MNDEACWFCDDDARTDRPPGGWLLQDETWRAGAAPAGFAGPGTVVLETRRHVTDQADFDERERATYAVVSGRLISAVRIATRCDRVYQWATMDRYPHFHQWLLPWWSSSELRGPRYLAASVIDVPADEAATSAAADAIRAALSS